MTRRRTDSGQGMTEYIIIVGLVAVALIAVISYFGYRSKSTFAKTGSALAGAEAPRVDPAAGTGSGGAAGQGGASGSSSSSGAGTTETTARAAPGIVSSGGGSPLDANFKKPASTSSPSAYAAEDASPWKAVDIPEEEGDTEGMTAFAGKMDRASSRRSTGGGGGGTAPGFPFGTLLLILLVAVGGGFVMVFLMKRT